MGPLSHAGATEWSLQATANPTPLNKSELEDISCPTASMCMGVGNDNYLGKGFAQVWNGSEWKMAWTFSGQLKAVSCPTTTTCLTLAKNENGAWRMKEFQFSEGKVFVPSTATPAIPAGATSLSLVDIACASETACTAVGRYQAETGEWKAHAERWNGSSWSHQAVPAAPGETRSPELTGVACPSATSCLAVGTVESRPAGSSYRKVSLAARWNGSSWSIESTPNPAGATSTTLDAVACFSSSSCMALGTYNGGSGFKPFSERLAGGSWSVAATATPADAKGAVKLRSISCATATACVAAGHYVSALQYEQVPGSPPAQEKTLVERWDGAQWTVQSSPNPAELAFSTLAAVSCSSQTVCTAVGKARPNSGEVDMVTLGVGWEEADSESPEALITAGPEGLIASAEATFAFEGSEIGVTFECSIDESPFGSCASPSTYKALGQGPHVFRARAKDAFGNQDASPAERAFEVDTVAPETTITSPRPTYTGGEEPAIEFTADEPGSTYRCSIGNLEVENCKSPYQLADRLSPGWHTFTVAATDAAGHVDPTPAEWTFNTAIYPPAPSTSKLAFPEAGKKSGSHFTLKAEWAEVPGGSVTGVSFQMKLSTWEAFEHIPPECVVDSKGEPVNWPLAVGSGGAAGQTEFVFFDARSCPVVGTVPGQEIQFRSVFDGSGSAAGASEPVTTEFVRDRNGGRVATDATETVGPGTVDLVTGAFMISRTDVSIPVPGTEATLEFSRFYDSTVANSLPAYTSVMGGNWQPSAPTEAENPGEVWTAVEEQRIEAIPAVYEKECWDKEGNTIGCNPAEICDLAHRCEEWLAEEAQPEQRWIEVVGTEGVTIPFEINGTSYQPPEDAKELVLTRPNENEFVLRDPNGTQTNFVKEAGQRYLSKTVSFQATPKSVQMVYAVAGQNGELRLENIIGPAPAGILCEPSSSQETTGCRTLKFEYLPVNHWTGGGWPASAVYLASIRYYNSSGTPATSDVVAAYNYNAKGRLSEAWDPRISPSLKEKYVYESDTGGVETRRLKTLTPPGEELWEFGYYLSRPGQPLKSVSRATLLQDPAKATTTIAYEVPVSGENAPYDMSPSSVARWGQTDFPVDATAIFPPTQVPDIDNFGFRSSFGSGQPGAGQLDGPRGAAIDAEGNIWVADTENSRIVQFGPEGDYISSFGSLGSGDGQLNSPRGLAFDSSGNIWAVDTGNNRIQKFSPAGVYLAKAGSLGSGPGQFNQPSGIAILSNGSIWVSDTGNDRVQRFSSSGAYVATVTSLDGPTGLAPRGLTVLVADTGNNRIASITPGFSTPTSSFGSQGSGDGQMDHPEGVGSDGMGYVWVADTGNNRIQQFTTKGSFVEAFGSSGGDPGQLSSPAGLAAVDGTGNLFVADTGNSRIEQWNSTTPPISDYTQATVHYMDPDGSPVNTASAAAPGVEGSAITTSETDLHGNVIRSLSAQNRLLALNAADSPERARQLDSHSVYSTDGTKMLESWGPLHQVRLKSGDTVDARQHTVVQYDEGAPALKEGESAPRLPTKERTGAAIGTGEDKDVLVTETMYHWGLRKQTEVIANPGTADETRSVTVYDQVSGQPIEIRQPKDAAGAGAGTTKFVYYQPKVQPSNASCESIRFAGLPCRVEPAAQTGTPGQPQLLVKKFLAYNRFDHPLEVTESPGGGTENVRKAITSYDGAGRPVSSEINGGGAQIPKTEAVYSATRGLPIVQRFVCHSSEPECDTQATTTTYDSLGRVTSYQDADGVTATTSYDFLGRPISIMDAKASRRSTTTRLRASWWNSKIRQPEFSPPVTTPTGT